MRLIVSVDSLHPPLTGIGRYTWELVKRLQATSEIKQLRFFRNGRWIAKPARLLTQSAAAHSNVSKAVPAVSLPVRLARGLYWSTTCRFNVFHAPNYFLPPFARNGVVTVHDLSVLKYPETHPADRVKQFERSFQRSLSIASQLITDSQAVRHEVISELGWRADRVTAIPLGVGVEYQPRPAAAVQAVISRYGLSPGAYTLCVATIEPRKRIDALLSAYRLLPACLRLTTRLVLVGSWGWRGEQLHASIDTARAEGWLTYLGYVPSEDLPHLYSGARLFAYMSEYEGFGLPVAEAMASGIPVVTSTKSCLPEVSAGAALLADPNDVATLKEMVERALTDDPWRHAAVLRGTAAAMRYTWEHCVERTMAVYRSALA